MTIQIKQSPTNLPAPECDTVQTACRFDPDFYTEEGRANYIKYHGNDLTPLMKPRIEMQLDGAVLSVFVGKGS
ncbi:hypothetical protein [Thiomicrorhabdus xiamenensis]|uniref:Uncharacterized protein n=1 Tax=Thiomicrorhabdus xiamenensis TaxID=2739063 RepID=A0A7D4SIP8_9GAMM|nr:hypothetical protein [Thiomicrorhabdus xiamenensis]QKI88959.1 hypothetical protein HQN79_04925 [Thiomicrorhabdus xiamenensis]